MALEKVKVVNTLYLPQNDVVIWDVETADGSVHQVFFKRAEFGYAININNVPTPALVIEFNEKIMNKEITIDIGGAGPVPKDYLK